MNSHSTTAQPTKIGLVGFVLISSRPIDRHKEGPSCQDAIGMMQLPNQYHHPSERDRLLTKCPSNRIRVPSSSSNCTAYESTDSSFPSWTPLSWAEARKRLRCVLEAFEKSSIALKPLDSFREDDDNDDEKMQKGFCFLSGLNRLWKAFFYYDLDTSAPVICSALFLLSTASDWLVQGSRRFHPCFLLAELFSFAIAFFCSWMTKKRKSSNIIDDYSFKKKIVSSYLKKLDSTCIESLPHDSSMHHVSSDQPGLIPATHLNDIYLVFRHYTTSTQNTDCSHGGPCGRWLRVPSLLLVQGDYIALQAGDTVPGNCFRKENPREILLYGTKVPPEQHQRTHNNSNSLDPNFLTKESLLADSTKLLHLCNNIRIFIMDETPMKRFLNHHHHVPRKIPQIHRQAIALRRSLFLISIISFLWTWGVGWIRSIITTTPTQSSYYSLLFLSAVGNVSNGIFICNFLVEIFGTSRILMGIHSFVRPTPDSHNHKVIRWTKSETSHIFLRYLGQVMQSRLGVHVPRQEGLIHVPPASSFFFEKLGVVTTLAFVDDELVCSPVSNPHQLLLPTDRGLKLLNLCSKIEDDTLSIDSEKSDSLSVSISSDSGESDPEDPAGFASVTKSRSVIRRRRRNSISTVSTEEKTTKTHVRNKLDELEVQFEDPEYWHYLPSLKCIGLCCLLVDGEKDVVNHNSKKYAKSLTHTRSNQGSARSSKSAVANEQNMEAFDNLAEQMLVRSIRHSPSRYHLLSLARCIGFRTDPNLNGIRGDISSFFEHGRFHVIATRLLTRRMTTDLHAVGLEESRHWGLLRSDTESVVVRDSRTNAFQLLTVGDARAVTELCSDCWQGEHCTLIPLSQSDRQTILNISKSWSLADLDVCAFSYAPVPFYVESNSDSSDDPEKRSHYLVDNRLNVDTPLSISRDIHEKWFVLRNQIFLGLLGSAASPRREVSSFLDVCNRAGVRFVYFSPRNMRRTKELASQMGIDVAWNCAISLRPLHEGEEADAHRMISSYADWDVNARLPHGVAQVRQHLVDVDNVPLLVHLFTDVTRQTTAEMLGVFKEYHETVLVLGLSHVHGNTDTFSTADLAIGINNIPSHRQSDPQHYPLDQLTHEDISFVCSITSYSCVLKLSGEHFLACMPTILKRGRAALDAGINAVLFSFTSYLSFSLNTYFCSTSIAKIVPCPSAIGGTLVLYVLIPILSMSLCFTCADNQCMDRVPPKNDPKITFLTGERLRLFIFSLGKAVLPAVAAQIIFLLAFMQNMFKMESAFLSDNCVGPSQSITLVRCEALKLYSGPAKSLAEDMMLLELALCITVYSGSFLYRSSTLCNVYPLRMNYVWTLTFVVCVGVILYMGVFMKPSISWSIFLSGVIFLPTLSLVICELIKRKEYYYLKRQDNFRRLQFETKLGMWSPKA